MINEAKRVEHILHPLRQPLGEVEQPEIRNRSHQGGNCKVSHMYFELRCGFLPKRSSR